MKLNYNLKNYLNRDWSNQLKGIAIILILLGHLQIIRHASAWGVAIFLIVSGFGLTQSYSKNGIDNFFKKRISKVLLPYFIVTLIWIITDAFIGIKHSIVATILTLLGINFNAEFDKTMWYITFILLWYLLFYLTFKFVKNDTVKIIILFLIFSIIFFAFRSIFPLAVGVQLYTLDFPIGVLLSMYYKKLLNIKEKHLMVIQSILTIGCLFMFYIFHSYFNSAIAYLLESLFFALTSISFFGLLSMYSIKLKFIEFIGNISFEIYLFEGVFINNYKFIFNLSINIWLERFIFFIFIICLSLILSKFIKTINNISKTDTQTVAH